MIGLIDDYVEAMNLVNDTNLRKRLCPAYVALVQASTSLTRQTSLSVIEFANSALDLDPKKALNAAHLAASGPVYVATLLALGILGLISPSAAEKTAIKIKSYLNSFDTIGPLEMPKIGGRQGWKKRIMHPVYGFSLSPALIMEGLRQILCAPLAKEQEEEEAHWNSGKKDIIWGLITPFIGIYGLLYPDF